MANFKGFKQVTLDVYNGLTAEEKKNYLWLVRELSGSTVLSSAIYFGSRKYAEVNDNSDALAKIDRLIAGLSNVVDENGDFVGFTGDHELLSSANTLTELFEILEAAILANASEIDEKADAAEVQEKLDELEEEIRQASAAIETGVTEQIEELSDRLDETDARVEGLETISSALTEEIQRKADADDVYTKEEVDAKVVGLFHFVGSAEAISEDKTTITVNGEDIVASSDNEGEVYQIGDAEYASNGTIWEKLGFNIDLSEYATKEYVDGKVAEVDSAVTATQEALIREIEERQELGEAVETIKSESTLTASTFSDADELDLKLGQIVYVTNGEEVSGITYSAGAYINTQDGLRKLDSTLPSTSTTAEERIEALENRAGALETVVGNTDLSGNTVTELVAELSLEHLIDGNDVEE